MVFWLQHAYIWLGFRPKASKFLVREQGIDSTDRLRVLTNKNANENADGVPDKGQHVSVIAKEHLK